VATKDVPPLSREELEDIIFRSPSVRRYTQDSLILPDVWFEFGEKGPDVRVDLLMVPFRNESVSPGDIARTLRERGITSPDAHVAYNQSTAAACLTFRELVAVVLPLGPWRREFWSDGEGWQQIPLMGPGDRARVARALIAFEQGSLHDVGEEADAPSATSPLVLWTLRLVGTIQLAHERKHGVLRDPKTGVMHVPLTPRGAQAIVKAAAGLIDPTATHDRMIYSVSRNRPANISVYRSVSTVKADAARRVFEIDAGGLRWAVIDSGIDATHPAFRKRRTATRGGVGPLIADAFGEPKGNNTRVIATYDFTPVRELLDLALLKKAVDGIRDRPATAAPAESPLIPKAHLAANLDLADALITTLERGLPVSWRLFAPLLEIPHVEGLYQPPRNEHGTHVAGILAGDWRTSDEQGRNGHPPPDNDLIGVCPNLELYDLRVLDDKGRGSEFAVMAALQFVRALNTEGDYLAVHGVNLSMSIRHDVANYACGRTPICEEAARLVANGATVVAAAGNDGYARGSVQASGLGEGYRSISITDPGNAEDVITVGATHGYRPLTYGVSYFSSRGPTGDGRRKPDVVAPGEKIWSAVPDGGTRTLDGTSMAAPHVSGCAALLMARHRELLGDPVRVKRVLCGSATDLGREPYFQGHGLVDVLRAIQSM
jgi:serine protease AprX